jgi:hypothetical protein
VAPATFTVVLTSQPAADVSIALSTSDATEGSVSPASLTFTPANWNTRKTVTVTGVRRRPGRWRRRLRDRHRGGDERGRDLQRSQRADVAVTNTDNDAAGIVVTPTSGLTTTRRSGRRRSLWCSPPSRRRT